MGQSELKVQINAPQHGWLPIKIELHDTYVAFTASCTPDDSVENLINALVLILNSDPDQTVVWNLEPTLIVFQFIQLAEGIVNFTIIEYLGGSNTKSVPNKHLEIELTRIELGKIFWRSLRRLETTTSYEDYEAGWGYSFPHCSMSNLSKLIKP